MQITLNEKDRNEIRSIAAAMPESELESVAREADERMGRSRTNPLMSAVLDIIRREHGDAVMNIFDTDDDCQIHFINEMRDLMVEACKLERSLNIFINKVA